MMEAQNNSNRLFVQKFKYFNTLEIPCKNQSNNFIAYGTTFNEVLISIIYVIVNNNIEYQYFVYVRRILKPNFTPLCFRISLDDNAKTYCNSFGERYDIEGFCNDVLEYAIKYVKNEINSEINSEIEQVIINEPVELKI